MTEVKEEKELITRVKAVKKEEKTTTKTVDLKVSSFYKKEDLDVISHAAKVNLPILIVGETGTGKTTLIKQVAKDEKRELVRVSINGQTGTEEILGKFFLDANKDMVWQDGILTDAVRNGKWIVFDEINAASPEVLFALHSLLDDEKALVLPEKANERIQAHKDFSFFATMNPDDYTGTKVLNMAFLSRFAVIQIQSLNPTQEANLIVKKTGQKKETARLITRVGQKLKHMKSQEDISFFCSTRDLEMVNEMLMGGASLQESFKYSVFNKISPEDVEEILLNHKDFEAYVTDIEENFDFNKIEEMEEKFRVLRKEIKELSIEESSLRTRAVDIEKDIIKKQTFIDKKETALKIREDNIDIDIKKGVIESMQSIIVGNKTTIKNNEDKSITED